MLNSVEEYLRELKRALNGCDRALVQDALSDAEEYLRNAVENARRREPAAEAAALLNNVIEGYGLPEEVAMAYRQIETRVPSGFSSSRLPAAVPGWRRFLGVVVDPRAWSAGLYLLFSLATGIIYFVWAVTGLSLSAGLLVLIIGIPFAGVFLLSVRGLALVEGRLVEALLGVRMPRRPIFSDRSASLWSRLKTLLTDRTTWTGLVYLVLMLPLGVIYFSLFVSLIAVSLWFIFRPVLEYVLGIPAFTTGVPYYTPGWLMPFAVIGGALLGLLSLHLFKALGNLQGRLAKALLVRE